MIKVRIFEKKKFSQMCENFLPFFTRRNRIKYSHYFQFHAHMNAHEKELRPHPVLQLRSVSKTFRYSKKVRY